MLNVKYYIIILKLHILTTHSALKLNYLMSRIFLSFIKQYNTIQCNFNTNIFQTEVTSVHIILYT